MYLLLQMAMYVFYITYIFIHTYVGLAVCPTFIVSHGHSIINGQQFGRLTQGTTVSVMCNRGYSPVGDATSITCSNEGEWNPNVPKCAGTYIYYIQ